MFAKHGTAAQLLLFEDVDAPVPFRVIDLDPRTNRTYHYWHVFVPGVIAGQVYAYRIAGLFDPARGLRFDPDKVLLDPYGKCIARPNARSREAARHPGDNAATALKSIVVDPSAYNWQGDAPLGRPFAQTIIYEMHVGGFTRHPSSGVPPSKRGTYGGLIEKIPYLQDLGVSAVELLLVRFEAQADEVDPGRLARAREHLHRLRDLPDLTAHPGLERALAGEAKRDLSSLRHAARASVQCMSADPHVRPAPIPVISTSFPSVSRPSSCASASASGIEPDEVFP